MADVLSQEEIDALLEVVEDDSEGVIYADSYRISKLEETNRTIEKNVQEHEKYIKIKVSEYLTIRYQLREYEQLLRNIKKLNTKRN